MNRTEIVKTRMENLSKLSDKELVHVIVSYFEENATMPGEKMIKDTAGTLAKEFAQRPDMALGEAFRSELIEEFASLCIKQVKLKNVKAANETKQNADTDMPKASDLPMVLTDVCPIPVNTIKNTFEMPVAIPDGDSVVLGSNMETGYILATLPEGFRKNHKALEGMQGTVIAADYSNGKFKNMSYSMLIDLAQYLAA